MLRGRPSIALFTATLLAASILAILVRPCSGRNSTEFRDALRWNPSPRHACVYISAIVETSNMGTKLERSAEQLGALGHPSRLAILRYVVQGAEDGTAAGEIQAKLDIPASTLSHHLDRLASAGLIKARRESTFIFYRAEYAQLKALTEYLWEDCCKRGKNCC